MRATAALLLWVLLGAGAALADPGDVETALTEVVIDDVQVSPDGGRLAYLLRANDFENDREVTSLWRLDLPSGAPVRLGGPGSYASLRWAPDGRALAFLGEAGGGFQLFLLEGDGAAPRQVTEEARFPGGLDLYDWLPDGSGFAVVAADPPDAAAREAQSRWRQAFGEVRRKPALVPAVSGLYRVGRDGAIQRLAAVPFEVPQLLEVAPDGRRVAIAGSAASLSSASSEVAVLSLSADAPVLITKNGVWEETLAWAGPERKDLYVSLVGEIRDGRYRATEARLHRLGGEALSAVSAAAGQEGYLKQQVPLPDGTLLVTANVSTRMRISRVDPAAGTIRTLFESRGWIAHLSASRDGRVIAFVTTDSSHYPEIYVGAGPEGLAAARPVTAVNATLTRRPQPEIETVSWDDGEGGTVEGSLFWPPGQKGAKGLPLVVELHGGPFSIARTEAVSLEGTALSYPALLAARGFLVLNVNYRGSAGRGDAFAQGIEKHRCSRPSQDVILGVESLVARGWADRDRLGVMGYSGGGGLSKCLLGRTALFRAAATGAGVWNDVEVYSSPRGEMWAESFFGSTSPWTDFELWWRESPPSALEQIRTPTLIVSGERDGDAPRQGDELYRALSARGVPTVSLIFPGEGHVFARPSNKRAKMRAEISWLEHHLLGKPLF